MSRVTVIIVGDEILTGKFADENGPYLIRRLRGLGADLERVLVLPDVVGVIADEVARAAARTDFVLTTGGVGPTHDDVTVEAIARAFDLRLEVSDALVALMRRYGMQIDDTTLRMARIPEGAELVHGAHGHYPVLRVRNVYAFPGVPRLMRDKFESLAERFAGPSIHTARLYTRQRESDIAARLSAVQARWPEVAMGSYPRADEGPYRVIVTLESRDPEALRNAEAELRGELPFVEP